MMARWKKPLGRVVVGVAVLVCLWWLRAPILSGVAGLLIWEDPPDDCDVVWIRPRCDGAFDVAAGLCRQLPSRRVVLVEPALTRLVQAGFVPTFEAICRRELEARGVARDWVTVIGRGARNGWEEARLAAAWFEANPTSRVAVLCDRFSSAAMRSIFTAVLSPEQAARVRIVALPSRRYDEHDWWQSRTGMRQFMYAAIARAYVRWVGEPDEVPEAQSPEDFEQMLDRLVAEASE